MMRVVSSKRSVLNGEVDSPSQVSIPIRNIGVVGGRSLSPSYAQTIGQIVDYLIARGYHIASGGAKGADAYVLSHLVKQECCDKGILFSAWDNLRVFPVQVREDVRLFQTRRGVIVWGDSSGKDHQAAIKMALLHRNIKLVQACEGLIAFLTPDSRGTFFTLQEAIKKRKKVVVFPVDRTLPQFQVVKWVPIQCGGFWDGAFRAVYLR